MAWKMCRKYYDIGLNLTDGMFQGVYNGKKYHSSDIVQVLNRASKIGVREALLTGSSITESQQASQFAHQYSADELQLGYTIGVHPCCANEFAEYDATIGNPTNDEESNERIGRNVQEDPTIAYKKLDELYILTRDSLSDVRFRAIGEIGLDYDRLFYASREMQLIFFEEQLKLSCLVGQHLPLFLHMRTSCSDFINIMQKFINGFQDHEDRFCWSQRCNIEKPIRYQFLPNRKFVTHSFTGSSQELKHLLSISPNSFVGLNGCSLRNEENMQCCKEIPLERLLLETDAPWCDIRRTHESFKYLNNYEVPFNSVKKDKLSKLENIDDTMVKGRNEPCTMEQVARVVANAKDLDLSFVVDRVWENSISVYGNTITNK